MVDLSGTLIANRYELSDVIGRGGQGFVCRALDRRSGKPVAVKMLTHAASRNREFAERLAREQQAMVALAGSAAVGVLDLCRTASGMLCLVMELLEGTDLEKHLLTLEEQEELIEVGKLIEILDPIVSTLEQAHDLGIVHRDLKPANIFIEASGGVRLLDFGLSRTKANSPLTAAGTIMGSPSYIAPEAWEGRPGTLDHRVDVYSLGVIVFRALSGRVPFPGESVREKFISATTAKRPSLHALRPELPPAIDRWVKRALAVDRNRRYATVRTLWEELTTALGVGLPERPYRPVADSLVAAWRAAATAVRRFVEVTGTWKQEGAGLHPAPPPVARLATTADNEPTVIGFDSGEEEIVDLSDAVEDESDDGDEDRSSWFEVSDLDLLEEQRARSTVPPGPPETVTTALSSEPPPRGPEAAELTFLYETALVGAADESPAKKKPRSTKKKTKKTASKPRAKTKPAKKRTVAKKAASTRKVKKAASKNRDTTKAASKTKKSASPKKRSSGSAKPGSKKSSSASKAAKTRRRSKRR